MRCTALRCHATFLQATTARVGMMGVMGNKGAVVVHLSLYDSTLCFVCAHMAAKRANIQGRNSDFWSILAKTGFVGDPETAWCVLAFAVMMIGLGFYEIGSSGFRRSGGEMRRRSNRRATSLRKWAVLLILTGLARDALRRVASSCAVSCRSCWRQG